MSSSIGVGMNSLIGVGMNSSLATSSIGVARCNSFRPRKKKNSSFVGFRPSMNLFMASPSTLSLTCSSSSSTVPVPIHIPIPTPTECKGKRKGIPCLMLPPPESTCVYKFYRLSEKDVKLVLVESSTQDPSDSNSVFLGSPYQGWMAYVRRKDCQCFLFNPLSGKKIILPSLETLPSLKRVYRNELSGLIEGYRPYYSGGILSPPQFAKHIIQDVVLSSSPMEDDCIAVITYGHASKLAFCRIRDQHPNPNCWILIDSPFTGCFQIVYHSGKKLFYTLSSADDEIEAWDLHSDPIKRFHFQEDQTQVLGVGNMFFPQKNDVLGDVKDVLGDEVDEEEIPWIYWGNRYYMVYDHQSQELFLVVRYVLCGHDVSYPYKTLTFDVFKFDFISDHLVKLQSLQDNIGNRAIFLGQKRGFALSTTEFPELRPGSIYFADDKYKWEYNFGGRDMGIYDCEEGSIIDEILLPPSRTWFIPDVDADF